MTTHAQAAAAIRKELKQAFPGTIFSVRAEAFSMGDAVRVKWTDGPTQKTVEAITDKYEYGSFNGMEDIYEYSNRRDDIPQVKYVTPDRFISREQQQKAVDRLNERFNLRVQLDEHGAIIGQAYIEPLQEFASVVLYRMSCGYYSRTWPELDMNSL